MIISDKIALSDVLLIIEKAGDLAVQTRAMTLLEGAAAQEFESLDVVHFPARHAN
jgi:hypothetical protein